MFNEQIIDEMLHFMKTKLSRAHDDIQECSKDAKSWCPFLHGKNTYETCYMLNEELKSLILYVQRYILCFEYLDIDAYSLKTLNKLVSILEIPERNFNLKEFKKNISNILFIIKRDQEIVFTKINLLTCEESMRLDEALNTYSNNSFFSCVVMAVSAVEARLHYLIRKENKTIYKSTFEKATLGQIIQLFDDNSYKDAKYKSLKKILPKKHKPLMEVLNYYRVFSAHPKTKRMDPKTAQSILNFSFNFLLDEETTINKKLTKCK